MRRDEGERSWRAQSRSMQERGQRYLLLHVQSAQELQNGMRSARIAEDKKNRLKVWVTVTTFSLAHNIFVKSVSQINRNVMRAQITALRRSQLRNDFSSYLFENRNLFMFEWIVEYELSYSYITVTPNNFGKGIY